MTIDNENVDATAAPAETTEQEAKPAEADASTTSEADKPETPSPEVTEKDASDAARKMAERKQTAQKRIDQLTREKHEANREAERLRARLSKYEEAQEPDPSKFDDVAKFDRENTRYAMSQVRKDELAEEVSKTEQAALRVTLDAFSERASGFSAEVPEYKRGAVVPIVAGAPNAEAFANEIIESDYGPQLDHYLSQNASEALRIASMPQKQMIREIAKLEAKLSQPVQKRVTKAPEPVKSLGGGGGPTAKSFENMSMADYAKLVAKETAKR